MPAIRNARRSHSQGRHSGRLENRVPIAYDNEGWEVPLGRATLQDLFLTRGDSLRLTPSDIPPPSTTSHLVPSSDLEADPVPEIVAVASNGNTGHVRPRSNSAISAASSTSSSSFAPTQSFSQTNMAGNTRAKAKPYSRPGNRIPRPRNAFIIFRSYFNSRHAPLPSVDGTKTNQNEVSKQAAKEWKSMTPEQQKPFQEQAKQEKEEHHLLYPDYRYAPNGKKSAPAKPKPKTRMTQAALRRKARQLRAEFSDSESEGEDSYSDRSATPIVAAPPAHNLRPRAEAPRYISPEPSPAERSPSPTPSVPQSPASSNDEEPSDGEDGWVETEDIPTLKLPLPLPPVAIKPLTGQGVDPDNMYIPLFVHDDIFPSTRIDANVLWASWSSQMAADVLSNDPLSPLAEASSSSASTSSPGGRLSPLSIAPRFGYETSYGQLVGTLDDLFNTQSAPIPPELDIDFGDWLNFPEDSDSAGTSGLGTELPQ
ncbi:hypothetical protein EST38_g12083 [Candolleomyces aberdarensis]|uniref:HMG box domain-containing protein n=1 Tax=Candolleomyces aberdarensis TaxID=2316362 RepID=A0A4Q2D3A9_9AGAR|nr:hypothetical protein EST38_g12083 [Candolleomyces aberdarensis]